MSWALIKAHQGNFLLRSKKKYQEFLVQKKLFVWTYELRCQNIQGKYSTLESLMKMRGRELEISQEWL